MSHFWTSLNAAAFHDDDEPAFVDEGVVILHPSVAGSRNGRPHKAAVCAVALFALGVAIAYWGMGTSSRSIGPARTANVDEAKGIVQLGGLVDMVTAMASGASSAARLVEDTRDGYKDANKAWTQFSTPEQQAAKDIAKEGRHDNRTEHYAHLRGEQLYPKNNMNDANPCPDTEEMHAGVCYLKCAVLTNGQYPIRTTAFSCCMQQPCSFFNSKFSNPLSLCSGLDVAGEAHHTYCPHQPGDCLKNEEFNLGLCYKKCSILTGFEYNYRFGANTCCKYQNHLACLDPLNTKSESEYNCGGGWDDEFLADKASSVHAPMADLAEVQTTTTLPTIPPTITLPAVPTQPASAGPSAPAEQAAVPPAASAAQTLVPTAAPIGPVWAPAAPGAHEQ